MNESASTLASGDTKTRRAPWGFLRALPVLAYAASMSAYAQDISLEGTPIATLACNVFNILTGQAAFVVALMVLAIGGIAIAVGGKKVIGGVVWGIIGVGIAIASAQIVQAIIPGSVDALCVS